MKISRLISLSLGFLFLFTASANAELKDKAGPNPKPGVEKHFEFDYEFGRPIRPDEMTYNIYRKQHMEEAAKKMHLPAAEVGDGMDTWHWWVGVDNPGFWIDLAKLTAGPHNYTNMRLDLLRLLMIIPREERFKRLGLINDPDCVAADKPDQFGMRLDRMKDGTLQWDPEKFGYSSGVIGLQLFKNENFEPKKWNAADYVKGGKYIEAPYKVGMACIFCHVGFNPLNPPEDTAEPKWQNITSTIGNQYLREGMAFGTSQKDSSIIYHYLETQEPGTSETSRFPYDSINNPTNINTILRLQDRLKVAHVENITPAQAKLIHSMYQNAGIKDDNIGGALGGTPDHPTIKVPHILTDGADSMGLVMASVRVYVNEGLMHKDWYSTWPINLFDLKSSLKRHLATQEFDIIGKERKDPNSPWVQTEKRMPNMATFLMSYDSFPLKEAKDGASYLSHDESLLKEGKIAFAENCASCHSSKSPENLTGSSEEQKLKWRELVFKKDFLNDNYLSDDARHSVLEIGTNTQRAMGTNAMAGSTWGQMSSQTYKDMRKEKITVTDRDKDGNETPLYNPISGKYDIKYVANAAYYRTPTLVSIWATAPYFHNNALGKYTGDPSVKGRMEAFDDAMEKMLWPEKRLGINSVKRTSEVTSLPDVFQGLGTHLEEFDEMKLKILQFPKGFPVNLLMNFNPANGSALLGAYVKGVLAGKPKTQFKSLIDRRREAGIEAVEAKLLELNTCPDFIEDRGHTFGSKLNDRQKKALIEYMKYF
jgi:hypothetical protein